MKKKTVTVLVVAIVVSVLLFGSAGMMAYRFISFRHNFVGTWVSGDSEYLKEFLRIDKDKRVTSGMKSTVGDFSEDLFEITYAEAKVKGNKLVMPTKAEHYLMSNTIFEESSLNNEDINDLARKMVDDMLTSILTEEEIDQVVTMEDNTLTIETADPALLTKILQVDEQGKNGELTYKLSQDKQSLRMIGAGVDQVYKKLSKKEVDEFHKRHAPKEQTADSSKSKKDRKEQGKTADSKEIEIISREKVVEEEPLMADLNKFAYYFLLNDDKEKRQVFIDEFVAEEAKGMFKKHLDDKRYYPKATIDDLYADERLFQDDLTMQLVSVADEVEFLLKKDKDKKIVDVFGPGWTKISAEELKEQELLIRVRPTMTLKYFVVYYVMEADGTRKEIVEENPEYATEDCQKLLLAHVNDDYKDFGAGTWHQTTLPNGMLGMIVNDSNEEPIYVLELNDKEQLAHVYGGNFETLSETDYEYVMANKGKKIGVF